MHKHTRVVWQLLGPVQIALNDAVVLPNRLVKLDQNTIPLRCIPFVLSNKSNDAVACKAVYFDGHPNNQ